MTQEGDLVLVHVENAPAFFARVEEISVDVKPEWFQVKMLVLQVPLMVITWILRRPYIDGEEFSMGGRPMRLEKVVSPEEETERAAFSAPGEEKTAKFERKEGAAPKDGGEAGPLSGKGKVVSLADRRKKDHPS